MKYSFFLCFVLLGGCTSYQETFDCEPGRGVGCKSLTEINQMVDAKKLPLSYTTEKTQSSSSEDSTSDSLSDIWVRED